MKKIVTAMTVSMSLLAAIVGFDRSHEADTRQAVSHWTTGGGPIRSAQA